MRGFRIDAATTNILTTFDTSTRLVINGPAGKRISFYNSTDCLLWATWTDNGGATPSEDLSTNGAQTMIPPNGGVFIDMEHEGISNNCDIWIRADNADATTGVLAGTYYN